MVFPIHFRFGDQEDIVQEEIAEVGQMVAFPVFNTALELPHSLDVLSTALRLVDLVRDTLGCRRACFKLIVVWILVGRRGLDKRL